MSRFQCRVLMHFRNQERTSIRKTIVFDFFFLKNLFYFENIYEKTFRYREGFSTKICRQKEKNQSRLIFFCIYDFSE